MSIYETRVPLEHEPEMRSTALRNNDVLRIPRLAGVEKLAVAVAIVMALGPLTVYAVSQI